MVSGLKVNLAKSQILCVNTDPNLIRQLEQMGVKIVQKMKYLGIQLSTTMLDTIQNSFLTIDDRAIRRRILANTAPTDMLHKSVLLNMAVTSLYTHALMALPVKSDVLDRMFDNLLDFMWTRQKDSETIQKRQLIVK